MKAAAEELLGLLALEGLGFKLKDYHWGIAMSFYQLGDLESAIMHAESALEHAESLGGGEEEEATAIRRNIAFLGKKRDKSEAS